jgi:hypothetical protein
MLSSLPWPGPKLFHASGRPIAIKAWKPFWVVPRAMDAPVFVRNPDGSVGDQLSTSGMLTVSTGEVR